MTHHCSREHDRELERVSIGGDVDVFDAMRDLHLGRLVNIHTRGLMIMGDVGLEEDRLYRLDLHVPEHLNGCSVIQLGVDCLWARDADLSGKFWTGFSIIDTSAENAEAIRLLIAGLGDAYA
jgi:hypothetical protein